jgi:DsbC/DsbD-like thiol-disulfide interchange protein
MTASIRFALIAFTIIFFNEEFSFGQGNKTVIWEFEVIPASNDETILKFTALIAEGWHLYSQHMSESGPMPTRFSFAASEDYLLIGKPGESGNAVKFYDDTYASEIIWYSGTVSFIQKIKLERPVTSVKGTVEYMTCNDHSCIPSRHDFNLQVPPKKKSF